MAFTLNEFIRESNRIEGIVRDPTQDEIDAHTHFLSVIEITSADVENFVHLIQPNAVLRDKVGLDVCVGDHIPPAGGPNIREKLNQLLYTVNDATYRSQRIDSLQKMLEDAPHDPIAAVLLAEELQRPTNSKVRIKQAYTLHHEYETLHPFTDGNGRSGRVLWLWMLGGIKNTPLGFLHHWYYQSLSFDGNRDS